LKVLKPRLQASPGLVWLEAAGTRDREQARKEFVMPNPKRRHSTRRTALRRSHDFLTATGLSVCPNCHEKKLPHHACAKCGAYNGRAVIDVKEATS
jgi:large subunit ribosomal protein L32